MVLIISSLQPVATGSVCCCCCRWLGFADDVDLGLGFQVVEEGFELLALDLLLELFLDLFQWRRGDRTRIVHHDHVEAELRLDRRFRHVAFFWAFTAAPNSGTMLRLD
ncbi:hypothetical protein LP420_16300 [Massilia sp. B-10]|nr:hypothetical protein LP420_16300 [Massilia sp. B-10]